MLSNSQVILEQEILGAILNNNSLVEQAKDKVNKDTFQVKDHKFIFSLLLKNIEAGKVIDVINFLEINQDYIQKCGGINYIYKLSECNPTDSNFITKLELLVENKNKEIIRSSCKNILEKQNNLNEMENTIAAAVKEIEKNRINRTIDIESDYEAYMDWLYGEDTVSGIPTGLEKLDRVLDNLQPERLITIFARSNVGKSTLAIDIAGYIANNGSKVIYGSGEMSLKEVMNKIVSSQLNIPFKNVKSKNISENEKRQIANKNSILLNNKFKVITKTNFEEFMKDVESYRLEFGLDVLFVDYVNKYINGVPGSKMTEQIGYVTSRLKDYALEKKVCVVMLAQANRTTDEYERSREIYEKLTLRDIQDSARIEQDSDQIIALYRNINFDNPMYMQEMQMRGEIDRNSPFANVNPDIINATVLKNRHGEKGTASLFWEGAFSRVSNWVR